MFSELQNGGTKYVKGLQGKFDKVFPTELSRWMLQCHDVH